MLVGRENTRINGQEKWNSNRTSFSNFISGTSFNNFLQDTNYNYSYIPTTSPGKCKTDYFMPELRIINSMLNIPSCSTIFNII
jgi:hypothetical protein